MARGREGGQGGGGADSIRGEYQAYGEAEAFYREKGAAYRNPHEGRVGAALAAVLRGGRAPALRRVLDLCCGSGEVTLWLRAQAGKGALEVGHIDGADPFTFEAYRERTGQAAETWDFKAIASGAVLDDGRAPYTLAVCSYALHLCDRSLLPIVCYFLSTACEHLLVLTPHKRPHLQCPDWGFNLVEERVVGEREREARTRARLYKSVNL